MIKNNLNLTILFVLLSLNNMLIYSVETSSPKNKVSSMTSYETVNAIPANDFLNSIGVVSAINARGENADMTTACAKYLGFRFIRGTVPDDNKTPLIYYKRLYDEANVRFACLIGSSPDETSINKVIVGAKSLAEFGGLLSIEGANEPNNWAVTYNGVVGGGKTSTTWRPVAEMQRDLYSAVKNDPVLKDYPVWNISESGGQKDNMGLQFLTIPSTASTLMPAGTKYADYACCHNYFNSAGLPIPQNNQTWISADPTSACKVDGLYKNYGKTWGKSFTGYTAAQLLTLPKVTTETGVKIEGVVTEEFQALMYMSAYLAQFKNGWSYTSMYLLRDRTDESGNQSFGFYRPDYSPRQAAIYLHNLTSVLADNKSIQLPGQLSYTIANRPSTVHELLLQKNDGTLELVVWSERYLGGSDNITVEFDKPFEVVKVYDPTIGSEAVQTLNNVSSVALNMTNHPFIIELNPSITTVMSINAGDNKLTNIYPNPVNSVFYLENATDLEKIEMFDFIGKNVLTINTLHQGVTPINIAHLAKGSYVLRVTSMNKKVESHKIIKL